MSKTIFNQMAWIRLATALLLLLSIFASSYGPAKAEDSRYFPETGKTVSGKFLEYWQSNGGLATYGFPITEAKLEVDPETGKTFLTQWFERNRFELHPENAGTKYEVLLGLLGKDLKREALTVDPDYLRNDLLTMPGWRYFSETGHTLSPEFLKYWESNGGLERFGYPISEQVREIDPETGNLFVMQWFERARFELHPENKPPYNILLGLLGNQLKNPRTGSMEYSWKVGSNSNFLMLPTGLAIDSGDNIYVTDHDKGFALKYNSNGQVVMKWNTLHGYDYPNHLNGIAIDRQDNIYISAGSLLQKFDQKGQYLRDIRLELQIFGEPGEICFKVDSKNNIYAIEMTGVIKKFDSEGHILAQWGREGAANGQLQNPFALDLDRQDNVYVLDEKHVQKFDSNGNYLTGWSIKDAGGNSARGLAIDAQNNVYVAGNYLFKYNSNGQLLAKSSTSLAASRGGSLAVNSTGAIFSFSNGSAINKYDQSGNLLQNIGSNRQAEGYFARPTDIVMDNSSGNLYIIDQGNNRIQIFDKTGHYLRSWGLGELNKWPWDLAVDNQGNTFVVFDEYVRKYNPVGQMVIEWRHSSPDSSLYGQGMFVSIAVNSQGNVYVGGYAQIQKYSNNGQLILTWGGKGEGPGQFQSEIDITVDSRDNVYVLDNNRVQKFDSNGKFLTSWGEGGEKVGQFSGFWQHIAIDRQDNLYTSEYFVNRIQKFDSNGRFLQKWPANWGIVGSCGSQGCTTNGMALDNQGNIYITYTGNDFIQKAHLR